VHITTNYSGSVQGKIWLGIPRFWLGRFSWDEERLEKRIEILASLPTSTVAQLQQQSIKTSRVALTGRHNTGPPWIYMPGKFPACRHQQIWRRPPQIRQKSHIKGSWSASSTTDQFLLTADHLEGPQTTTDHWENPPESSCRRTYSHFSAYYNK